MIEIICVIAGTFVGELIVSFYFIWTVILTGIYLRYSAERLLSAVYPNVVISIF